MRFPPHFLFPERFTDHLMNTPQPRQRFTNGLPRLLAAARAIIRSSRDDITRITPRDAAEETIASARADAFAS